MAHRALVLGSTIAASCLAAVPMVVPAPAAGAQTPPVAAPPVDAVARVQQSVGVVRIRDGERTSTGWIAGDGLVVTSDVIADQPGKAVSFASGADEPVSCYAALVEPQRHLAFLRCAELEGAALDVATGYPEPGAPVTVAIASLTSGRQVQVTTEVGTVTANDFEFMNANRLQFSTWVDASGELTSQRGILTTGNSTGAPVLDGAGHVVSTILAAPDAGGQPIGTVPSELAKSIKQAEPLPATFSAAAVLTVARRSLIPAVVGLVIGLIWGAFARNGSLLAKTLGLTAVGLVGAVAYTLFTLLVVGPETLIG